jgi:hypothetical protein
MKKILTICVFTFAFLIGTQNSFAQEKQADATQSSIKEDVKRISNSLGLNTEQTDAFAEAYMQRSKLYESEKSRMTNEVRNKIEQQFSAKLKGILTKSQFESYRSMTNKK